MNNVERVQQHLKTIATAHSDYVKTSFEQSRDYVEKLAGVKSLEKAVELHSEYTKSAYDTFMSEATKIGDLYKDFAKEAFGSITSFGLKSTPPAAL